MTGVGSVSDSDLLARMPGLVLAERGATLEVVVHLLEIDRRRLYLDQACSSLYAYCTERLGYSEDEAMKRVRVTRVARRLPQVLEELKVGGIHLSGLFVLSSHLTDENVGHLLAEARGKSRREIELLVARMFPRPDVPDRIDPTGPDVGLFSGTVTCPGTRENRPARAPEERPRLEPLSGTSYRVEFTASAELRAKIQRAEELLSHTLPTGDLAALFERALDELIERESKRRLGAGKKRKPRKLSAGSRHVPVDVVRIVYERDGHRCTFVDAEGHRCSERHFLTIEHCQPHALGGPPTPENLRVLCAAHNAHTAREVFGESHVDTKRCERERAAIESKVLRALVCSGFRERDAKRALREISPRDAESRETMLRAALLVLVPAAICPRTGGGATGIQPNLSARIGSDDQA